MKSFTFKTVNLFRYILATCVVFSISACGSKSSSDGSSPTPAPKTAAASTTNNSTSSNSAKKSAAVSASQTPFEKALLGYFKGPLKVTRTTGTQVDNWVRNDAWIYVYEATGYPGWYELDIYNQDQILTDSFILASDTIFDAATNTYSFTDGDATKWETRYTIKMDGDKMDLDGELVLGPSIFAFKGKLVRVKSAPF